MTGMSLTNYTCLGCGARPDHTFRYGRERAHGSGDFHHGGRELPCGPVATADEFTDLVLAVTGLIAAIDAETDNADGKPVLPASPGCFDCTRGTRPDRLNTGLCAYHRARRALEVNS